MNLFLSSQWATAIDQPAPLEWQTLSVSARADAIRSYCRQTVSYLKGVGVRSPVYQIGNEVEYGVCGVYTREEKKRENVDWIRRSIWMDEAVLLAAACEGVKAADPHARLAVHIAHWFNAEFGEGFFRSMIEFGVPIDVLGASYYPSSGIPEDHFGIPATFGELGRYVDAVTSAVGKPLLFAEYAYPSTPAIEDFYAGWNRPAPGYPLTPEGQRDWLRDFLGWCANNASVLGAFYWSPECYARKDWEAFALFFPNGTAKPALDVFRTLSQSVDGIADW
jgi:arabinogalactan endo-1,4-beta-galactosidase